VGENNINDLGTILVVDDEKSILDALVREFSFHNFTVYTAGFWVLLFCFVTYHRKKKSRKN
jgi:hypothetical protein